MDSIKDDGIAPHLTVLSIYTVIMGVGHFCHYLRTNKEGISSRMFIKDCLKTTIHNG